MIPRRLIQTCKLLFLIALFTSCESKTTPQSTTDTKEKTEQKNDETARSTKPIDIPPIQNDPPEVHEKDELLYTWVDELNIRSTPNAKGYKLTKVESNKALKFLGETSDESQTIVLRGVAYHEPWYKIETPDGQQGWVFGGAVKEKGEQKGNAPITDMSFDFPYFGAYDLSEWKFDRVEKGGGGDAENTTIMYTKGNRMLTVESTEVGEYGYSYRQKLSDLSGNLLKEREFHFAADVQPKELTETVKDYAASPPRQYQRIQKIDAHFMTLNSRPQLARAPWTSSAIEGNPAPVEAFDHVFEVIESYADLPIYEGLDDGCSCSFRTHKDDYKSAIFLSTYEDQPKEQAVIQLDGKVILLNSGKFEHPDYKRGDYHAFYSNEQYELRIVAFEEGKDDGGGPQYAGTMKLSKKDGTIIQHINAFGGCGC
ncbi:MAG: SH3 domain-containing protein [Bacteroidota bacterium]